MDINRLVEPDFDLQEYFPQFRWNKSTQVVVPDEGIVVVDPIYLADVYNDETALAAYVRTQATFIYDFGGDWSGPVWLTDSYLLMPASAHYKTEPFPPADAKVLCDEIGCDSGSFVLLPLLTNLPVEVRDVVKGCLNKRNAALLKIPPGVWGLMFEQFHPPQPNMVALYRNIVLMRSLKTTHNKA